MNDLKNTDWKEFFFSFNGRINRKKYWMNFVLPVGLISIVLAGIDMAFGLTFGLSSLFSLIAVWPKLATGAKRLHDRELSGWWQAAPIAAFGLTAVGFMVFKPLGILFLLIAIGLGIWIATQIGFLKGTDGPNRFGADSLSGDCGTNCCCDKGDGNDGAQKIKFERVGAGE